MEREADNLPQRQNQNTSIPLNSRVNGFAALKTNQATSQTDSRGNYRAERTPNVRLIPTEYSFV